MYAVHLHSSWSFKLTNKVILNMIKISKYTGGEKKGYKIINIICLLFYKTEEHILLNVMYVVLEWVCQIWTKFNEAKLRHVSLNCLYGLHDISTFGYCGNQIIVVVERVF